MIPTALYTCPVGGISRICQYKTAGESASQSPNVSGDDRSVLTELVDLARTLYLGSLLNNCCATLITSSFL
jgi:hypothetical protein